MAGDHLTRHHPAPEPRRDAYLAEVAARLRGPRHVRGRILAELGDGLDEAIADHTAAGGSAHDAVTAAIARFGSAPAVADAFAGELATAYARHTLTWYVATGPLVGIWWLLLLHPRPWHSGPVALLAAIPVIPIVAAALLTATGTIATTGRLIRWLPETFPSRALAATRAVAGLAIAGDLGVITFFVLSDPPPQALAVIAVAASLIRIGCGIATIRTATGIRQRQPL